jgi:glycosyltransferase involved in cell wall biosynthesis
VVPYPVPLPACAAARRDAFGLAPDAFVTLAVFDAASSVERKNPLAAIAAHGAAFGERADRVLVLKTYNTAMGGAAWRAVAAAAQGRPNIRIIDRHMAAGEVSALIGLSDAVLSLHRAEGYGLALAEAMMLARPVVATGWSGNMAFMDHGAALLVGHRLVAAGDARGTYDVPGAHWAEPDIAQAAEALRRLAADAGLRARVGEAGRRRVAALTPEACGALARAAIGA